MKTFLKFSFLMFVAVSVASCCDCRKGSPKIGDLEKNSWLMTEFEGTEVPNSGIVLTFDAEKKMVYGKVPCNNFFAAYSIMSDNQRNIEFRNPGRTQKFCPDSQLEDKFVMQLMSITNLKMDSGKMLMVNSDGKLVAIFTPQPKLAK